MQMQTLLCLLFMHRCELNWLRRDPEAKDQYPQDRSSAAAALRFRSVVRCRMAGRMGIRFKPSCSGKSGQVLAVEVSSRTLVASGR